MSEILAGRRGAGQTRADFFHKPNMDLVNQALGARQQKYNTNYDMLNKFSAKMDEVHSLDADTDRWFEIKDKYDKRINEVLKANRGDLSKSSADIRELKSEIGDLFGIHGEAQAIDSNYLAAMKNRAELKKRREEDKITEGQYRGWDIALANYKGVGSDPKAWNSWQSVKATDKIDIAKESNDFLKNKEADLRDSGWKMHKQNGKLVWSKDTYDDITYDSIQKELGAHLDNLLSQTGQMKADYNWQMYSSGDKASIQPTLDRFTSKGAELRAQYNSIANEKDITKKQQAINALYGGQPVVDVDGEWGPQTEREQKEALAQLQGMIDQVEGSIGELGGLDEDQIKAYHYKQYSQEQINKLVEPYAGAKSRTRHKNEIKVHNDIYAEHALKSKLQRQQANLDMALIDHKFRLDNPMPPRRQGESQAITKRPKGGITMKEGNAEIAKNNRQVETGMNGLLQKMHEAMFPNQTAEEQAGFFKWKKELLENNGLRPESFTDARVAQDADGNNILVAGGKEIPLGKTNPTVVNQLLGNIRSADNQNRLIKQRQQQAQERGLAEAVKRGDITPEELELHRKMREGSPEDQALVDEAYEFYKSKPSYGGHMNKEDFTNLLLADYDGGYTLSPFDNKTKERSGLIHLFSSFGNKELASKLRNQIVYPRQNIESKMSKVNQYTEEAYAVDNKDEVTFTVTTSNNYLFKGAKNEDDVATRMKAKTNYFNSKEGLANIRTANAYFLADPDSQGENVDDYMRTNGYTKMTVGTVDMTDMPGHSDELNWYMPITFEDADGNTKTEKVMIPASQVRFDFGDDYGTDKQIQQGVRYQEGMVNKLRDYTYSDGQGDFGQEFDFTIEYAKGDFNSPGERRINSTARITPKGPLEGIASTLFNDPTLFEEALPLEQAEQVMRDYNQIQNYYTESLKPYGIPVEDTPLFYQITNNETLTTNTMMDDLEATTGYPRHLLAKVIDATQTGKKRSFIPGQTIDRTRRSNYSIK